MRGKFWAEEVARDAALRETLSTNGRQTEGHQTTTFIFHVIGTLTMAHVKNALESLDRQRPEPPHWERFVLYNGSPLDTQEILRYAPLELFDEQSVFPYDPSTPKGAVADWDVHMREISGTDRYFTHKSDFFLGERACHNFDRITDQDFYVLFKKVDMKERARIDEIRNLALQPWADIKANPEIGRYPHPGVPPDEHLGKLGVLWDGYPLDGTMHGYSDSFRKAWAPSTDELNSRHIWMQSMYPMLEAFPYLILDDDFFALHQFHAVPEKADQTKLIPGERF